MTDISERELSATARIVLSGLSPTHHQPRARGRHAAQPAQRVRPQLGGNLLATVPLVLVGTMAMTLTGPVAPAEAKSAPKFTSKHLGLALKGALGASVAKPAQASSTPKKYTVTAGDTVSSIAKKFDLSTASVLALNGLSWKSIIHPGQVLILSKSTKTTTPTPAPSTSSTKYTVVAGDTVGKIAKKFGVTTASVLTANKLSWSSVIYPGQKLTIPAQAPVATPAPTTPAPSPSPAPTAATKHTIVKGETISSIAKKYGVSVQALLSANGLVLTSIIYAGQTLTIPATTGSTPAPTTGTGSTPTPTPPASSPVTVLNEAQKANALTIISVGSSLGVSDYGIVIALATAMQESALRNINYGHLDSVGLFQQRPSSGWGSVEQLTDPVYASKLFYGGPLNPNKGKTRGLLDIPGWQNMTVAQAAQKVQVSAHPDAYAQWETSARAWLAQLR